MSDIPKENGGGGKGAINEIDETKLICAFIHRFWNRKQAKKGLQLQVAYNQQQLFRLIIVIKECSIMSNIPRAG